MSKKFKITVTACVTYEPNPDHYPEGLTWDQMLDMDIAFADDEPFFFLDREETEWTTNGEIQE